MSESQNNNDKPKYWKSLQVLENPKSADKLKHNEFIEGVTNDFDLSEESGLSRRKFIAIMGASAALTATACKDYRDKGAIMAYNKKPDNIYVGQANYYASTCTQCSLSCGILIKTREGRPIKIDGNPEHPINKGKICAKGQANIFNLYHPERIQFPMKNKGSDLVLYKNEMTKEKWENIDRDVIKILTNASNSGKEVAIITHSILSPSLLNLLNEFKIKYPATNIYSYEYYDAPEKLSAWESCYGKGIPFPIIKWDEAKVILSLNADFLGNESNFVENIRLFAQNRNVEKIDKFNRLYMAEAGMSLTGMNSDYRLRIKPELQFDFVMSLMNELVYKRKAVNASVEIIDKIKNYDLAKFSEDNKIAQTTINHLVDDLIKFKGQSIVYGGDVLSEPTHIAINILNELLGNIALYDHNTDQKILFPLTTKQGWNELIGKMYSNQVAAIIHLDSNPALHFPKDLGYITALGKVPDVITMSEFNNETTLHSKYVLAVNHNFESWGDFNPRTGILSLQQPVISPLYDTRQKEAVLLNWLMTKPEDYKETLFPDYIKNYWEINIYPNSTGVSVDFNTFWFTALHDGITLIKENASVISGFNNFAIGKLSQTIVNSGYTLLLTNNYTVGDGKFSNNGWILELPHPVTKVTWDNYAAISPSTAKELNVRNFDYIEVSAGKNKLTLPVLVQPGMTDKTIHVELGFGRKNAGEIGSNVGFDAGIFLSGSSPISKYVVTNLTVSKAEGTYTWASTQEHHALDDSFVKDMAQTREIIREGTVDEYKKNPDFMNEHGQKELITITKHVEYHGTKWAMAIDMNKCVGCLACVTSCNVENNIPIVGKDQVIKGREMHWMRIDRYYSGEPDEPVTSNQPMLCQHCDNAPCENVCPVAATNHSPDGLNQMAYNRCVGTRYCSNNCPFKVRRYNFYDFRDHAADSIQYKESFNLMHNPEVTVRSRGVMEKCTFCIQRIMEARQDAIKDGRPLKGTDVKTACQVACPAEAITFGDANEKNSEIAALRNHKLGYYVLEELNVKPNVTYIARLRNKISEDKA